MQLNLGTQELIAFAAIFAVGLVASALGTLYTLRVRGVLNEKYRPHRRRRTDKGRLTRPERRVIQRAKRLRAAGRTADAAKILEENGLLREAVYLADKDGLVLQAAEILMRAGKPHRAGAIYAKHKKWKEAIDCFVQAGMPYEVATCYRKLGDYKNACEYYKAAKRFGDAAWCYEQLSQFQAAARLFRLSEQPDRAAEQYIRLATDSTNDRPLVFDQAEIDFAVERVESGNDRDKFLELLRRANALADLLRSLPRLTQQTEILTALVDRVPTRDLQNVLSAASGVAPQVRADLEIKIAQKNSKAGTAAPTTSNSGSGASARIPTPSEPLPMREKSRTTFDFNECQLFSALPEDCRTAMVRAGQTAHVAAGELIPSGANDNAHLSVVTAGEVEWRETRNGRGKVIQRHGPGTVIGGKQLLFDEIPHEQILAYRDCEVWTIETKEIETILDRYPTAAKTFYRALARETFSEDVTAENHKRLIA